MAPDLNTISLPSRPNTHSNPLYVQPASGSLSRQNSTPAARRTSQIHPMSPPPLPLPSSGTSIPQTVLSASHQGQSAFPPLSPNMSGPISSVDSTGVPMRHPRPMTPAELHLELEREQEAVVNRLTRELSVLRAHSASVASTASNATDSSAAHAEVITTGHTHPTPSGRHRSSSSLSRSGLPPGTYPPRYSNPSQQATSDPANREHRSSNIVSTPRYEELAQQRAELEEAKKENEMLKQRIRELERMIGTGNATDAQRGRIGAPSEQTNGTNGIKSNETAE